MPPEVAEAEVQVLTKTAEGGTPEQEVVAEPAAEPDYKALHEATTKQLAEQKAAAAKLEQQLRSAEGISKERLDMKAELARLRRGQTVLMEYIQATGKGIVEGDTETLGKNLSTIASRHAQEDAQETEQQEGMAIYQDLLADAADAGLNAASAPELEEARTLWDKAIADRDIRGMRQVGKMVAGIRREHQKAEIARVKAEAETETRKKLVAAGIMDSPAIRASGAGAKGLKELEAGVASGQIALTPAIKAQLEKHWNS